VEDFCSLDCSHVLFHAGFWTSGPSSPIPILRGGFPFHSSRRDSVYRCCHPRSRIQ
jgi:hypothetical protein